MTVINMMSFGDSGAAIADEQSSTRIRKYNVAQKLQVMGDSIIYGGSGASDFIGDLYTEVQEKIVNGEGPIGLRDSYGITKNHLFDKKNSAKNDALYANAGITLEEIQSGVLNSSGRPLSEGVKTAATNIMQSIDNAYDVGILLGGIEKDKFEIYRMGSDSSGGRIVRPYESIGSGSDEADKVLSKYVSHLPRDKRESIDPQEGLIKLIEATNAASNTNIGVGGTPSIVFIDKDGVKRPSENQCILASEIVEGYVRSLLNKKFVYNSVNELIRGNGDFEKIEERMKRNATSWQQLDRFLRGYKG